MSRRAPRSLGSSSESTSPRDAISALQRRVALGIHDVEARAEHGAGGAADVERAAMRVRVDAARHAADDAGAGARQRPRQLTRDPLAIGRGAARADDRHAWAESSTARSPRAQSGSGGRSRSRSAAG